MFVDKIEAYQAAPWFDHTPCVLPEFWRAKVSFEIKQSRYIIKTAQTREEFQQVIELRTEVFLQEFAGKDPGTRRDLEPRDIDSDFLIIKDTLSQQVLASYRLICSDFSQDFYSKSEFDISGFLSIPGKKLELSRACVRADRRSSGILVHLLWRGLSEYVQRSGSRYLFGCSSLQTLDLPKLMSVFRYLRHEQAFDDAFAIQPLPNYRVFDLHAVAAAASTRVDSKAENWLPPLLLGYLKAGARIYGTPAYDEDFACLDLFTVLDFDRLSGAHLRKYIQTA